MIENKLFRTRPVLFHAAGRPQFNPVWESVVSCADRARPQAVPARLTIITFNNGGVGHNAKVPGLFERSLKEVPVTVLGRGVVDWKNCLKIGLLADELDRVETEYVLVSDSSDVVLVGDLSSLLPGLATSGAEAVFNAERQQWPPDLPPEIDQFERSLGHDHFPYLNAGLWVARTEFASELVRHCRRLDFDSNSEQLRYKHAYRAFYPRMVADHTCRLFQNTNRVSRAELSFDAQRMKLA